MQESGTSTIDGKDGADIHTEPIVASRSNRRRRSDYEQAGNAEEVVSEPHSLIVNKYIDSPLNALDLMAKICSAKTSAKRDQWEIEINKILEDPKHKFLERDKCRFIDLIKENRSLLSNQTFDKDLVYALGELMFAMDNEIFDNMPRTHIAIGGSFNAGKSTLLNYILEQPELLPENTEPTTIVPAYLYCRKDTNENHFYGVNQRGAIIPIEDVVISGIKHGHETDINANRDNIIRQTTSEKIASALDRFVIEIKHSDFEQVAFIDTPGVGNIGTEDTNIANRCIESADMLLFLIDCKNGSLSRDSILILDQFTRNKEKPIVIIITRNDIIPTSQAEDVFNLISNQVSANPCVKDVICLSALYEGKKRKGENVNPCFLSRSKLSLFDSINRVAKECKRSTAIDRSWGIITDLFSKECSDINSKIEILQHNMAEVKVEKLSLWQSYDHQLVARVNKAINEVSTGSNLLSDVKHLIDFYDNYCAEILDTHQKVIDIIDKTIVSYENIRTILEDIYRELLEWKTGAIRNLNGKATISYGQKSEYSAFEAIDDILDINLNKLISSMANGCNVTTMYNDGGFSILTYAAYRGNIPALLFILNRLSSKKAFMRDRNKRNIMHAAAEGMQFNTLNILKVKYPNNISKTDDNGKTCDDIIKERCAKMYK